MCTFSLYLSLSFSLSFSPSLSLLFCQYACTCTSISFIFLLSPPPLSPLLSFPPPPPLRLGYTVLLQTQEGEECPQMKSLLNDRLDHYPITTPVSYTPRLFHLSSSTGWFRAIEETHIACPEDMSLVPDHFPFIQETVYNAVQPGTHGHILIVSNIRRILF